VLVRRLLLVLTCCLAGLGALAPTGAAASGHRLAGSVKDASGAAVAGATVSIETASGSVAAVTTSRPDGTFTVEALPWGNYVVRVVAKNFAEHAHSLEFREGAPSLDVWLNLATVAERVTVTASLNDPTETAMAAQPVNVVDAGQIRERHVTVVAQTAAEEAGLAVQRTSPSVSGIFVRGLTGNKVNVFVDGVRYSTGAQRGGINTFLNLIEPTSLEGLEVLRGPGSAQYGSDALGGSVQFMTAAPSLVASGPGRFGGTVGVSLGSADRLAGGNALLSYSTPRSRSRSGRTSRGR
jgi:outer membrane receptor protein involved in Fe transport